MGLFDSFISKKKDKDILNAVVQKLLNITRVPTAEGKHGKYPKKIPVREIIGNLEILPKLREFGFLKL